MRLKASWVVGTLAVAAVAGGLYVGPRHRGVAESHEPMPSAASDADDHQDATPAQHGHEQHASQPQHGHDGQHDAGHSGKEAHEHAAVPAEYANAHLDPAQWTNPRTLEHGRKIYAERCAVCHGERGDGQGPGAKALKPAPASFRDARMMGEMSDAYMFWRVSEGNTAEPFKRQASAMPPWKLVLSTDDRWAVIAYLHSFSGHDGPHTAAAHREQSHSTSSSTEAPRPSGASHDHSAPNSPSHDHSAPTPSSHDHTEPSASTK